MHGQSPEHRPVQIGNSEIGLLTVLGAQLPLAALGCGVTVPRIEGLTADRTIPHTASIDHGHTFRYYVCTGGFEPPVPERRVYGPPELSFAHRARDDRPHRLADRGAPALVRGSPLLTRNLSGCLPGFPYIVLRKGIRGWRGIRTPNVPFGTSDLQSGAIPVTRPIREGSPATGDLRCPTRSRTCGCSHTCASSVPCAPLPGRTFCFHCTSQYIYP